MAQLIVRNKLKFLHGEELFKHYMFLGRAGSVRHLQTYAMEKGWSNPNTGKEPTAMGVWCSMWRWVLHNPEKARPMYSEYVLQFGENLTDSEWNSLLESRAHELLTPAGYRKFLHDHPELKKYADQR
jgi:hypothetical protein